MAGVADYTAVAVAAFTLGLLVVAVLQWLTYRRQASLMHEGIAETRRSIAIAERNAEAATAGADAAALNAKALVKVERAYVTMSHEKPGIVFPRLPTEDVLYNNEPRPVELRIRVQNHGNTPARVTAMMLVIHPSAQEPLEPHFPASARSLGQAFLVQDDHVVLTHSFAISREHSQRIHMGQLRLWLFGRVDYIDAFGVRHRAGYTRVYVPSLDGDESPDRNNLAFWPDARFNYDRERANGEGEEWHVTV